MIGITINEEEITQTLFKSYMFFENIESINLRNHPFIVLIEGGVVIFRSQSPCQSQAIVVKR